jgi:hypothetical protein
MLMLINLTTVILYATEPSASMSEQPIQPSSEEFAYSIASIYDNENLEP